MKLIGKRADIDEHGMTTVDLKKLGYQDEPFVLAKDVTQVFYVKYMSSKSKKDKSSNKSTKDYQKVMRQSATWFWQVKEKSRELTMSQMKNITRLKTDSVRSGG